MKHAETQDIPPAPASALLKVQGGAVAAIGLVILALVGFSAADSQPLANGPLSAGAVWAMAVWVALLGLVSCVAGARQLFTGQRHRALQILLAAMFIVTLAGALLILRNFG